MRLTATGRPRGPWRSSSSTSPAATPRRHPRPPSRGSRAPEDALPHGLAARLVGVSHLPHFLRHRPYFPLPKPLLNPLRGQEETLGGDGSPHTKRGPAGMRLTATGRPRGPWRSSSSTSPAATPRRHPRPPSRGSRATEEALPAGLAGRLVGVAPLASLLRNRPHCPLSEPLEKAWKPQREDEQHQQNQRDGAPEKVLEPAAAYLDGA